MCRPVTLRGVLDVVIRDQRSSGPAVVFNVLTRPASAGDGGFSKTDDTVTETRSRPETPTPTVPCERVPTHETSVPPGPSSEDTGKTVYLNPTQGEPLRQSRGEPVSLEDRTPVGSPSPPRLRLPSSPRCVDPTLTPRERTPRFRVRLISRKPGLRCRGTSFLGFHLHSNFSPVGRLGSSQVAPLPRPTQ